ncbi:hypothetical protein LY625_07025 [Lysobacter sp. GX 14042]|uniref:hypothetical protein n=1 Tax=Lysobacter sp. GX 14042 TaxID=2907155 RepID=UPI001F197D41|nr:hypothetical protein [Lysobacter sp. GX 14042]MCE7032375.1 hypothetical protein [Lysobacter sp. GX 14042]
MSKSAVHTTGAKVFFWLAVILAGLNLFRFVFSGWALDDLLAGAGFALIAYGATRNGFGRPVDGEGQPLPVDPHARIATLAGMALVVVGLVLEAGARG